MSEHIKYDRNIPFNNLALLPPPEEKVITIEVLKSLTLKAQEYIN